MRVSKTGNTHAHTRVAESHRRHVMHRVKYVNEFSRKGPQRHPKEFPRHSPDFRGLLQIEFQTLLRALDAFIKTDNTQHLNQLITRIPN